MSLPRDFQFRSFWPWWVVSIVLAAVCCPAAMGQTQSSPPRNTVAYFTDVAQKAGLTSPIVFGGKDTKKYIIETTGTGAAIFDNDGWEDLYVTYYGKNRLYHNQNGVFTEVAEKAGVAGSGKAWGTGCAWVDYDRDGHLDLMIANYVDFDLATAPTPGERPSCVWKGVPVMCGPRGLGSAKNILYHSRGDGTFEDVTTKAHIDQTDGHYAFSVSTFDYNDDGWPDIYVACDSTPSILYRNNGDGTFDDVTSAASLGLYTKYLGWGTMFLDFDNDGWPDLLLVNGHVYPEVDKNNLGSSYKEPRILYHNNGDKTFRDISAQAGPGITAVHAGRGLAIGDLWNDGRISAVISNMNAIPSLLVNQVRSPNHWIGLKTVGTKSNRDGIGARVTLKMGARVLVDEVRSGSSYDSNCDIRVHFGLGAATKIDWIRVRWPSGLTERFENMSVDAIHTVKEGSGSAVAPAAKSS